MSRAKPQIQHALERIEQDNRLASAVSVPMAQGLSTAEDIRAELRALNQQAQQLKYTLEPVFAVITLVIILPLFLLLGALVYCTSPGPVFYRSTRIGYKGQAFGMMKFRTMRPDADLHRDTLRQANAQDRQLFKLNNDPRSTWIGKLLRKTSLDELPQLLNIIWGDMSFVGPRPLPPEESQWLQEEAPLRFAVKPGVTGLWQISARSIQQLNVVSALDCDYVRNWSIKKDLTIIAKTIPAVLFGRGAC